MTDRSLCKVDEKRKVLYCLGVFRVVLKLKTARNLLL